MVRGVGGFVAGGLTDPVQPHSDLVPLGFGPNIYVNPDEPVSPFDCERWPESPYCGGNPFSRDFMDLGVEMVRDDCNIGIDVQATLGFVKFPHFQAVYRAPGCRGKEPDKQSFDSKPQTTYTYRSWPTGYSNSEMVVAILGESRREKNDLKQYSRGQFVADISTESELIASASGFSFFNDSRGRPNRSGNLASASCTGSAKSRMSEGHAKLYGFDRTPNWYGTVNYDFVSSGSKTLSWSNSSYYFNQNYTFPKYTAWEESQKPPGSDVFADASGIVHFIYLSYSALKACYPIEETYERIPTSPLNPNLDLAIVGVTERWRQVKLLALHRDPPQIIKYPPPPPSPRKPCCMSCCNSPKEKQNEDLLKLILKRVNDLHKKVGETDLPASVPTNLADASKGITQIQNLAHFSAYIVKQLDAVTGQYPIEIKIKDTDLTKEGDQNQTIKLPNQAEAIAEMFGICMATKIETDAILKAVLRGLIDAGSHKSTAVQTYYYAKGISEFLAYKAKQKVIKVPFAFSPGETTTDKVLKEKEVEIKVVENADEDDIKDALAPLLELAAMWKSQNFRKVNPKDAKADLLRILKQIGAVADNLGSGAGESSEEDFDAFLEKVERGWTGEPGATDTEHPYGRAYDERPRLREIGISGDQEPPPP